MVVHDSLFNYSCKTKIFEFAVFVICLKLSYDFLHTQCQIGRGGG